MRDIGKAIGCSPTTAGVLARTGAQADPLGSVKKPGPKSRITPRIRYRIRQAIENARNPKLRGYRSVKDFKKRTKCRVLKRSSDSTCRRVMREVLQWKPRRVGLLWGDAAARRKIIQARLEWCESQLALKTCFSKTIYLDCCKLRHPTTSSEREKFVQSQQAPSWWVTRDAMHQQQSPPTKMGKATAWHSSFVKFLAVRDGPTEKTKLYYYDGNMNGETFFRLLKKVDKDFPLKDRITVSDNDSSQKCGLKKAKAAGFLGKLLYQPPRSPDLSTLDSRTFCLLLPRIARWLEKQKGRTTKQQVKSALNRNLPGVDKSMAGWEKGWRGRLRKVVELKGELLAN